MKLHCGSKIILLVFGFCFAGFSCLSRAYATGGFQELGVLPGYSNTHAYDISGDGSTVVGWCWNTLPSGWPEGEAFRWKDGIMIGLGCLPMPGLSPDSIAFGVSADGSVVVGLSGYHPQEIGSDSCWAFRWAGGTMSPLPAPVIPGYVTAYCSAHGVSADGSVVVGDVQEYFIGLNDACRWGPDGTVTLLGSPWPSPYNNSARRVSSDGSVVVGFGSGGGFRWEGGTIISIGDGGGNQGANGVSADGSVVVGVGFGGWGFRWENGTMTSMGQCTPSDVSADGSVIVGHGWNGQAFIWDANHGLRNLRDVLVNDYLIDLQGYPAEALDEACGISDDGFRIIGSWWIATLDMGMITAVRGNATLDAFKAKVLDRIRRLSVLETGGDGKVRLDHHPSGSEIDIGLNSKMQVDGSVSKTNLDLIYGRLKAKLKNLPAGYDFEIRTPQAVLGVRGTELVVETTTDESKTIVLEGEVDVSTPDGGKTITLGQNQGIIATAAGLGVPFTVDPSQIDRWWEWGDENTPPGKDVVVSDPETGTTISFDTVDEGGETTVTLTSIGEGPPPPGGLKIVPLGTYYEINTTAEFSGTIHFELEYDDTNLTEGEETALKLLQYDEGTGKWVDITTGLDTQNNIISGETVHLSFFAVTTTVTSNLSPVADAGPDQTVEQDSEAGASVTLDGSASSDPDGDPLTYSWTWDGESATGVSPTVVLPLGTTTITLVVNDGTEDSEPDTVDITVGDTTPPEIDITFPLADLALQDVVTLTAEADDWSGVSDVYFYVREPGGEQGVPIGYEELSATFNETIELWEFDFDTTELLDGYYVILAKAVNTQDIEGWSEVVPFSIRNWAVVELLPASENNKAGRTMPVKFALRIAEVVDPDMLFIYNEELEIRVYNVAEPGTILQTSLYGEKSTDYRIDIIDELYITNFKTMKQPAEYVVEIWRMSKDFLVGGFTFETVK